MLSVQVARREGGESHLVVKNDKSIFVVNLNKQSNPFEYVHSTSITECAYLPSKQWLLFADSLKKLHFVQRLDNGSGQILAVKELAKRPAKFLTNASESKLVIGDKTGDVYLMDLKADNLDESQPQLLMGHMSMLTDMIFTRDEKSIISCDRDEKVRVSTFPNSYNIEAYLLAHKEFVTGIELIDETSLLSASGDGTLVIWNLKTNEIRQHVKLNEILKLNEASTEPRANAIDQFDFDAKQNRLLVHTFKSNHLAEFSYCPEAKQLSFVRSLEVQKLGGFNYFVGLADDHVLTVDLSAQATAIFAIKKLTNQGLAAPASEVYFKLEGFLNEKISLTLEEKEEGDAAHLEDFESFFKSKVDNMHEYYERKQGRIDEKTAAASSKRKRVSSLSSTTSNQQQQQQQQQQQK